MANASLCEFDISPLRAIRPETLKLQWTGGKDALNSLSIHTRLHHYSVPVWKRWRTSREPAMIWTAVVTRSRLPPHFNQYIFTRENWTKLLASDVWDPSEGQVSVFIPIYGIYETFTLQHTHCISSWRNYEALQWPRKPLPASYFGSKKSSRRFTDCAVHQLWR